MFCRSTLSGCSAAGFDLHSAVKRSCGLLWILGNKKNFLRKVRRQAGDGATVYRGSNVDENGSQPDAVGKQLVSGWIQHHCFFTPLQCSVSSLNIPLSFETFAHEVMQSSTQTMSLRSRLFA